MLSTLTAAQQQAVVSAGPLIVSASAGSGKTRVLVERYVRLLLEGYDVRRIVAMTFTRKAAAEMLDRVARRLEQLFARAQNAEELLFLRTVRERLVNAQISTFHSYCSSLLRRFPIEAGIPPVFGELSIAEWRQLLRDSIRTTVEEWIASERRQQLADLIAASGSYGALEAMIEALLTDPQRLAALTIAHQDEIYTQQIGRAFTRCVAALLGIWKELDHHRRFLSLRLRAGSDEARIDSVLADVEQIVRHGIEPFRCDGEWRELLDDAIGTFHTADAGLRSPWKKIATFRQAQQARRHAQLVRAFLAADSQLEWQAWRLATWVGQLAQQALDRMDAEKILLAAFEPDDLQRRALALLDVESVRQRLQWEVEQILVDEFQDTDPIEYELLSKLVPLGSTVPDIPELFIVGDPKQSIYGFRGADVRVFDRARSDIVKAGGADVHLQTSFRMTPQLVALVNTVMRSVMPATSSGYHVGYEELCTAREHQTCPPSAIGLLIAREDGPLTEAELVARHIVRITSIEPLTVWDEDALREDGNRGMFRAAQFRDIVLLARKSTIFEPYVRALRAAGIPFRIESGKGFYQTQEVLDVVAFLRVVYNCHDDVALATLLRSPFIGLDDSQLALIANAEPQHGSLYERLMSYSKSNTSDVRINEAVALLQELLPGAIRMPPTVLIRWLLRQTPWYRRIRSSPRAMQIEANVEKLLEAARHFEQRGFRNLLDFVEELDQLRLVADAESEAAVISDDNVVTLMTIHAAKGLEFPIVYIVGADQQAWGRSTQLLVTDEVGIALSAANGQATATGKLARWLIREREEAEEQRLLYVALTRAKDHLFIAGTLSTRQDSDESAVVEPGGYLGTISDALDIAWSNCVGIRSRILRDTVRTDPTTEGTVVEIPIEIIYTLEQTAADVPAAPASAGRVYVEPLASSIAGEIVSATQLLLFEKSPKEFYRIYRCGLPAQEDDYQRALAQLEQEEEIVGTLAGRIIHRTLEYVLRQQRFDRSTLEVALQQVLSEYRCTTLMPLHQRAAEDVQATLDFLHAQGLLDGVELFLEQTMMIPIGEDFLLGVPDVFVRTPHRVEIWDWKTNRRDSRNAEQWMAYYRTQLDVYALLASYAVPEQEMITVRLIATRPPVEMASYVLGRDQLDDVEERIRQMITAIKRTSLATA